MSYSTLSWQTITRYHIQQNTKSNFYHKVKISLWTKDAFKANPNSHQLYISFSVKDREVRDGKERTKKKTWRTFEKFLANVQCKHTFYQLSDKGLSRRTWLNFCCQTVLWSKTTPIKEERSRTVSSKESYICMETFTSGSGFAVQGYWLDWWSKGSLPT